MIEFLKSRFSQEILQIVPLGKGGTKAVWTDVKNLSKILLALKEEQSLGLALDFVSVFELNQELVVSLFFRSRSSTSGGVIRYSVELTNSEKLVRGVSAAQLWPAAQAFEREAEALFGIQFCEEASGFLPVDWKGFPLRKGYIFPSEYQGIPHMRPAQRATPDEYGGVN